MSHQPPTTLIPQDLLQVILKQTCLHLNGGLSDNENDSNGDDSVNDDDYDYPGDWSDAEDNSGEADDSQYDGDDERSEDDADVIDDESDGGYDVERGVSDEDGSGDYYEDDDRDYSQ